MKIKLNGSDTEKLIAAEAAMAQNARVFDMVAGFLNENPRFVTAEDINEVMPFCNGDGEMAFCAVLTAAFGLDESKSKTDKTIIKHWFSRMFHRQNPSFYLANPYLKTITLPEAKCGSWDFFYEHYEPYEGFAFDESQTLSDYSVLPNIGFFSERFEFLSVRENGVEWMSLKPNEQNTVQNAIDRAHGKTVTFGLGLGYFAFMASQKPNVDSVTIVEREQSVIDLFKEYILPQFPNKQKIRVVNSDAFDYFASEMKKESFDFCFGDIWHDESDGFGLYMKMRALEKLSPATEYNYWIEKTLLARLRRIVFGNIFESFFSGAPLLYSQTDITSFEQVRTLLCDGNLRQIAPDIIL